MNFRTRLSKRIGMNDIHEITYLTQGDDKKKQELYKLLFDKEDPIAYQAAWVFCHFSLSENKWLFDKQNELIDEVLITSHGGKKRLLLNLLFRQPVADPFRVDFLDFCMERMISRDEALGVQSICMKLAYEMCRTIPELLQELNVTFEMLDTDMLAPALISSKRRIMKAMKLGKSLQVY